jgi:hypothetical protein
LEEERLPKRFAVLGVYLGGSNYAQNPTLILAMAAMSPATANASGMVSGTTIQPVNPSGKARDQEKSFNVFFDADQASLTPEGREIISEAAKQFMDGHGYSARVFVVSNTPTAEDLPSLQEWQNRRILIAIRTKSAFAKVAN